MVLQILPSNFFTHFTYLLRKFACFTHNLAVAVMTDLKAGIVMSPMAIIGYSSVSAKIF